MKSFHDYIKERGENNFRVAVVTTKGMFRFYNLTEAKKIFPTLDPLTNTKDFTWAMAGDSGWETMRFEDWATENQLSI